ncbi:MAG: hypothetical protein S4CHLAM6_00110 [Chlamydiae bacterium]|nr:hypothetical protein [Chlamydiota bacterium]
MGNGCSCIKPSEGPERRFLLESQAESRDRLFRWVRESNSFVQFCESTNKTSSIVLTVLTTQKDFLFQTPPLRVLSNPNKPNLVELRSPRPKGFSKSCASFAMTQLCFRAPTFLKGKDEIFSCVGETYVEIRGDLKSRKLDCVLTHHEVNKTSGEHTFHLGDSEAMFIFREIEDGRRSWKKARRERHQQRSMHRNSRLGSKSLEELIPEAIEEDVEGESAL